MKITTLFHQSPRKFTVTPSTHSAYRASSNAVRWALLPLAVAVVVGSAVLVRHMPDTLPLVIGVILVLAGGAAHLLQRMHQMAAQLLTLESQLSESKARAGKGRGTGYQVHVPGRGVRSGEHRSRTPVPTLSCEQAMTPIQDGVRSCGVAVAHISAPARLRTSQSTHMEVAQTRV